MEVLGCLLSRVLRESTIRQLFMLNLLRSWESYELSQWQATDRVPVSRPRSRTSVLDPRYCPAHTYGRALITTGVNKGTQFTRESAYRPRLVLGGRGARYSGHSLPPTFSTFSNPRLALQCPDTFCYAVIVETVI